MNQGIEQLDTVQQFSFEGHEVETQQISPRFVHALLSSFHICIAMFSEALIVELCVCVFVLAQKVALH